MSFINARVSKTDDATRNLETQLHILQEFGIREEHIFTEELTGSSMSRPAWNELMARVRPDDTVVVAWLDRFSRNFDEGVRIRAELTKQNIGVAAISEGINAVDDSAAGKLFRRMMLTKLRVEGTDDCRLVRPSRCRNAGACTSRPPRSGEWPAS